MNTETKPTKYFFLRDERRTPVGCVASKWKNNRLYVGLSTWNPKDRFDRREAKLIAFKRMSEMRAYWNASSLVGKNVKLEIMRYIVEGKDGHVWPIPHRARKAAQLWIDNLYREIRLVGYMNSARKPVQSAKRAECADMDAMFPLYDTQLGKCDQVWIAPHPKVDSCYNWRPI